jgi:biopolymer transport protein ExbD
MKINKFDSINVIPFIDIILVLLVIVLTTATFIAKGVIPLDLATAKSADVKKDTKELSISIKKNGEIYFDDMAIKESDIEIVLMKFENTKPISISCDKEMKFDNFVFLLDILKAQNFTNINIITNR